MAGKTANNTGRPIEHVLAWFAQFHNHPINRLIHYFSIPLSAFAIMGLIWSIPFPYLGFLGKYNGFVNWASFAIAFSVYYYYRLSQVLSYAFLLMIFAFSAGIVGLEKLQKLEGYTQLWMVCLSLFVVSLAVQFTGHRIEGKVPSFKYSARSLLIGPLWLFHLLFKRAGIRY